MPTTEERNKETDARLDKECYEALDTLPRWNDFVQAETLRPALFILGFEAVVKAILYVGSCIRAQRIDG